MSKAVQGELIPSVDDARAGRGGVTAEQPQQGTDPAPDTRLALLRDAISNPACDPAKLALMLDTQLKWEANEERKAFALAMAGFAADCPIIEQLDPGDKSTYAKLDRIYRGIRPIKAKHGIWLTWLRTTLSEDKAMLTMCGLLGHSQGHSESIEYVMPFPEEIRTREGKSVMNLSQRMGSGISYCKRYGECAILGVVTGKDTDGRGVGGGEDSPLIDAAQVEALRLLLKAAKRDEATICRWATEQFRRPIGTLEEVTVAELPKCETALKAIIERSRA
jgi:hypothetical protein